MNTHDLSRLDATTRKNILAFKKFLELTESMLYIDPAKRPLISKVLDRLQNILGTRQR